MAALRYDPVVGPQAGNAASAVNDAARNVSAGLSALGSGLTNLGERQEKRVELANQKREAQIKNTVAMYAQMAPDDAALQALMGDVTNYISQPGAAPDAPASIMDKVLGRGSVSPTALGADVDFASMFANRRTDMRANDESLATIRSTDAGTALTTAQTAGANIKNQTEQLALDDLNKFVAVDTEFAGMLTEADKLARAGDKEGYAAARAAMQTAVSAKYGAAAGQKKAAELDAAYTSFLGIKGSELGNTLTSEQILGERQDRSIAASAEADRARLAKIDWQLKTKEFDKVLSNETTSSRLGTIIDNAYGLDHAIELVDLQTDLTPAERNTLKEGLYAQDKADPKFFEKMNPSKTQFSYPEGSLNPNRVAADVVATIQSRKRDENSSVSIFEKANAYDSQGPDVAVNIKQRFEERKIDEGDQAWLLRLRDGEFGNRKLTDGELVALVDEGFGASGMFRNEVGFNRDKMKKLAKKYGDMDPSVLSAEAARFDRDAGAAMRLEARVSAIESEIVRAQDARDVAKVNSLTAELETITADLTGLMLSYRPDYNKKVEPKPAKAKSGKDMTAEDFKPNGRGSLSTGRPENAFPVSDSDIIPRRGY